MRQTTLKILFVTFMVIFGLTGWAKTKVALIGDSPEANKVADLTLAKLVSNDNLEFLERSVIEKVLREHKLQNFGVMSKQISVIARLLYADIFAVLSSAQVEKETVPSSLRVFDAHNGFCLLDTALPAGIAKCAEFVSEKLKGTVKILANPQTLKYVSILAVRNAGAPIKYKRQMTHIAIELERRLIAMPDVAVLERSELGLVNRERELTAQQFGLNSSALLLDFEFLPGSQVDQVNLTMFILSPDGKEQKRINIANCLNNIPESNNQLAKELFKYLKSSAHEQKTSAITEGARFFQEYRYAADTGDFQAAERKLEAAIALAPDNPDYLFELNKQILDFAISHRNHSEAKQSFMRLFAAAQRSMEIGDYMKPRFPNYRYANNFYLPEAIRNMCPEVYASELTVVEQEEVKVFLAQFRSKYFAQERTKFLYQFDLSDGINSLKELKQYNRYLTYMANERYFLDADDFVNNAYQVTLEQLQITASSISKNQELLQYKPHNIGDLPVFFEYLRTFYNRQFHSAFERLMKKDTEVQVLIKLIKQHPAEYIQQYAGLLELLRSLILCHYDERQSKENFDRFLDKYGSLPDQLTDALLAHSLYSLVKISQQAEYDYRHRKQQLSDSQILQNNLNAAKSPEELAEIIIANQKTVVQLEKSISEDYMEQEVFNRYRQHLEYAINKRNSQICKTALQILNHGQLVIRLKQATDFGLDATYPHLSIVSTYQYKDEIYLLLSEGFIGKPTKNMAVWVYNLTNNQLKIVRQLIEMPLSDDETRLYETIPFYVDSDFCLIGIADKIIVVNLTGNKKHTILKDIPGNVVQSFTILNSRIFVFSGEKLPKTAKRKATILCSFNADGSDRKIHISTLRRDKKNLLDSQPAFAVTTMLSDTKNQQLIFTSSFLQPDGIWSFSPATGVIKKLFSCQYGVYGTCRRIDNKLYLFNGYNDFYIFNLQTHDADNIFYNGQSPRFRARFASPTSGRAPFWADNRRIWYLGSNNVHYIILDKQLSNYEVQGPGQRIKLIYPHPAGDSVLIINDHNIFRVTPRSMP